MSRDKVDVAKRVTDAYNRRDVDGLFAELATPDFEWYPGIVRALDGGGGYRLAGGGEVHQRWAAVDTLADGLCVRVEAYLNPDEARAGAERLAEERG